MTRANFNPTWSGETAAPPTAVPQRYGTAFHLVPPFKDVQGLPLALFHSAAPKQLTISPVFAELLKSNADPYLWWQLAHRDQLDSHSDVVAAQATSSREEETTGDYVSRLNFIEVLPHANLTLVDIGCDHQLAIRRTLVVVHEGAQFTYWGLRCSNAFLTETVSVQLAGAGAAAAITHLLLDGNTSQADIHVAVEHAAANTTSRVTARLAAQDKAHVIYRGLITVEEQASGASGYQQARALLLSPDAVVDVLPELKINTNEVKCSHGVTTLHLDEAALFYLRSRGVTKEQAEKLARTGFFHEGITMPARFTAHLEKRL